MANKTVLGNETTHTKNVKNTQNTNQKKTNAQAKKDFDAKASATSSSTTKKRSTTKKSSTTKSSKKSSTKTTSKKTVTASPNKKTDTSKSTKTTKSSTATTSKAVTYVGKTDGTYNAVESLIKTPDTSTSNIKPAGSQHYSLHNNNNFPAQKSGTHLTHYNSLIGKSDDDGKKYVNAYDPTAFKFEMNYNSEILNLVDKARKSVNYPYNGFGNTPSSHFAIVTSSYNRFKIPNPNEYLAKSFSHVFFTRPDCNLLTDKGKLTSNISDSQLYLYAYNSSPELLQALCHNGQNSLNKNNHFMMFLSNQASSFSLSDEYINKDSYGKTWVGDKIAYGKHDVESKAAGDFNITYTDDKRLHVYQLHRLWVEYISKVYTGIFNPKLEYQKNRIMDYASSVYYIMTDETGEEIIFWSKYYGVFPTTIPSNQYSWGKGNVLNSPDIEISYQFSFKEDYNPLTLLEFNGDACVNTASGAQSIKYEPTFDPTIGSCGTTYVGTPFIQTVVDSRGNIHYKLRFMPRK